MLKTGRNAQNELTTRIRFMDDSYPEMMLPQSFIDEHKPKAGGYLIKRENGHLSYCPPERFGVEYTPVPIARKLVKTRLIPIWREASKHCFIDETLLKPRDIPEYKFRDGEEPFKTSAIKIDKTLSLLGISQCEELFEQGKVDCTDSLDKEIVVERIHLQFDRVIDGKTHSILMSFGPAPDPGKFVQKTPEQMYTVEFNHEWTFTPFIQINGFELYYKVHLNASCNLELGNIKSDGFARLAYTVKDSIRQEWNDNEFEEIIGKNEFLAAVGKVSLVGYELEAYRIKN